MAQIDWILYLTATTFYALSSIIYIISFVFKKEEKIKFATGTAVAGLLFHSISIALRWIETGHGPYISMYEVLSKYAWFSVIIFLFVQNKYEKLKVAGFIIMPASLLMMAVGSTYSRDIQMIPASLRSYWLITHVGFASLAFGSILIAVGIAVLYLLKEKRSKDTGDSGAKNLSFYDKLPDIKVMDDLMYRFVASGFLFLTIMIGSGAVWANQTWGRYWGWDPKETWSLITWLVYAALLHSRMVRGWKGNKLATMTIIGFCCVLFTYFGVNYLAGLHSYAQS